MDIGDTMNIVGEVQGTITDIFYDDFGNESACVLECEDGWVTVDLSLCEPCQLH